MRRAGVVLLVALTTGATTAAAFVRGGYEGTTDQNLPVSFKVGKKRVTSFTI